MIVELNPYRSAEEAFFARMARNLPSFVPVLEGWKVERVTYEAKTFLLDGGVKYTPDFNVSLVWVREVMPRPEWSGLVNVEVKGSKKQRGYDKTRVKLVTASAVFPEYVWIEVLVDAKLKVFESFEVLRKSQKLVYAQIGG